MPKPKAVGKVIVEIYGETPTRTTATLYPTLWRGKYRVLVNGKRPQRKPVATVTEAFAELRRFAAGKMTRVWR